MIICGLDIASSAGVALIDPAAKPSTWRCLAIESHGETTWEKIDDFDAALRDLLTETCPDFAVIEKPLSVVVDYGSSPTNSDRRMINAATTITLAGLAGAAIGVLNGLGIPYGLIADRTWRSAYFGKGYKPRKNWKDSAVDAAKLQGIPLPPTKRASEDAAEAIGIAVAWSKVNILPARHRQAFMDLRLGKIPQKEVA